VPLGKSPAQIVALPSEPDDTFECLRVSDMRGLRLPHKQVLLDLPGKDAQRIGGISRGRP
jgi:hypothetical protein